jgi:probable F420-dependent oxidoreductase
MTERNYWALVHNSLDFATDVRRLEHRGVAGIEVSQDYGPPFGPLSAAAVLTERLKLASGIAMGLVRSPFETAMAAMDLDRLSKGRFHLGLGTGPGHFTKGYFGMPYDKPVSRLREVVQILRHVEDGARTGTMKPWNGEFYQMEFEGYEPTLPPHRERIPVWIAALRGRLCEVAGEVADGLIGHPVWSVQWALGQAQESLAKGAASAGRDPSELYFQPWVAVSIDRDPKAAVDAARPGVAFYAGLEQYAPFFEAHDFGKESRKLQEALKSMSLNEAAKLVPDEMVKTFAACGTPDQVLEWIEPLWQRANSILVFPTAWGAPPDQYAAKAAALADTFWPA